MVKNTNEIPIFFASDDNYSPLLAVALASLCYTTKEKLGIFVLDNGISAFHKRQISSLKDKFPYLNLEFISINTAHHFGSFPLCNALPLASYSRLMIPSIKPKLKKVIYSDVDVIFLKDVAELFEQDLQGNALGATYHACFDEVGSQKEELHTKLKLTKQHKYFYSGNLVLDCDKWREKSINTQIFENIDNYKEQLTYGDQCALNHFFNDNNYKHLDYRFCLTTQDIFYFAKYDADREYELRDSVVIRHFETSDKPWITDKYKNGNTIPNFDDFWFFAEMTPFYAGLQQRFVAAKLEKNNIEPPLLQETVSDTEVDVGKNTSQQEMLTELRKKIRSSMN